MTIPEKAVEWALSIANDNSHGYSQENRWGPDYDCSSFVISAYEQAGVPVKEAGASYTGNMKNAFRACGFQVLPAGSPLKVGDVLLNEQYHTVMAIGNGQVVAARRNEDGFAGDGTGREITTQNYYYYPNGGWDCILRYAGSETAPDKTPESSTVGQQMAQQVINARYTPDTEAVKENMLVPVLELYLQGKSVEAMQSLLILRKIDIGPDGADGYFGSKTYKGLCEFQTSLGRVSGKCDGYTWDKLIKGADKNDSADN